MSVSGKKDLSQHILPTSATMVGVCMTVISLIKLFDSGRLVGHLVDKVLAVDSLLFLLSAVFSYLAIRAQTNDRRLESWADNAFMVGLVLMVLGAVALSFELI
jgi:hypothetical protein